MAREKYIMMWCAHCSRVAPHSIAIDTGHNVCQECGEHFRTCNGCDLEATISDISKFNDDLGLAKL